MAQKYYNCVISLWLLFQLFIVGLNCQVRQNFVPTQGSLTTTFINNKLYFLNCQSEREFFYLDVSAQFNTNKLMWKDLSAVDTVPQHDGSVSVIGGADNNTIFLYGGLTNDTTMALVYTFDPQNNEWTIPKITGDNTARKGDLTGIKNNKGKLYLWGGINEASTGNKSVNDMLILDTINLSWGKGSSDGAPTPRKNYGAVLLPNQNILYMGGHNETNDLALDVVYIYDTINDKWNSQKTIGSVPSNKANFSAVLGLDGQRVIIFGGSNDSNNTLYVLNLNNFEWSVPKISGQIPTSRSFHKADVIGKYMVVSFGMGYNRTIESDILLLDISNDVEYTWTDTFNPPPSSHSSNSSQSAESLNPTMIVTLILSVSVLSFGCFYLYKWKRKQRKALNII